MIVNTEVRFDRRRIYRLIGHDLYSASADEPLEEQEYAVEKPGVIKGDAVGKDWQVIVRDGEVCLRKREKPR